MYRNNENIGGERPLTEYEKGMLIKILNYFRTTFRAFERVFSSYR